MILDLILALVLIWAVIKGYQRGLIVALFSVAALIVGLAAALKLSTLVAGYLGKSGKISDQWLPLISFVLVFIVFLLLVRWLALLIQKTIQLAMLGWINRLGGILLYAAVYILIFSVLLFYADQMGLIKNLVRTESVSYSIVQPWGPLVIEEIGKLIPIFKGMFGQLQDFFGTVSRQLPAAN